MVKTWRLHREVDLDGVLANTDGTWARINAGAPVSAHDGGMSHFEFDALVYFPADQWWYAIFLDGAAAEVHVDIATPARFDGSVIITVDLDLDVRVEDGFVSVVDREEFETHCDESHYSDHFIAEAEEAVSAVVALIDAHSFPFDRTYLEHAAELAPRFLSPPLRR